MTSRLPAPPRHRSQYVFLAGLAVSVAYAAVHIAFSDPALIEGTAPVRLSLRNYLGPVLGSGMVWALFAYLMGKACAHRRTTASFAGAGILLLMLAVHYALLFGFGIYDWQTAFPPMPRGSSLPLSPGHFSAWRGLFPTGSAG